MKLEEEPMQVINPKDKNVSFCVLELKTILLRAKQKKKVYF